MRGLIGGFLLGVVLLALAGLGVTLLAPPPQPDTGTARSGAGAPLRLEEGARPDTTPRKPDRPDEQAGEQAATSPATGGIEIPAGSQFNRPGEDRPTDAAGAAAPPTPSAAAPPPPAGAGAAPPPAPDTTPAIQPEATTDTPSALSSPAAGDAPARTPAPGAGAPRPATSGTARPPAPAAEDSPEVPAAVPPHAPGPATPERQIATAPQGRDGQADVIPPSRGPAADGPPAPAPPVDEARAAVPMTEAPAGEAPPTLPEETPPAVLRIPAPAGEQALPGEPVAPLPGLGNQTAPTPAPRLGALARYAMAFDAPAEAPLMAVVLRDPGESGIGRETLTTFPFPVSFAVAPEAADAEAAIRRYRTAGFEVVLAPGTLPPGGHAADIETAMESWQTRLPETVAMLVPPFGGSGAARRARLEAIAAILDAEGRGLIAGQSGLAMAVQVARAAGVPAAPVGATLPAENDQASLLAALDKAAFKARQRGAVIIIARGNAATARALFTWAGQDRQSNVRFAPVSAVLRRAGGG